MHMFMVSLPVKRKDFVKVYYGENLHRFLVRQTQPVHVLLSSTWTWGRGHLSMGGKGGGFFGVQIFLNC